MDKTLVWGVVLKVFLIEHPCVSAGLKRTYFKKLEVFEGTATERGGGMYVLDSVQFCYKYTPKKGWVKRPHTRFPGNITRSHLNLFSTANTSHVGFYTTLEAAQVSKLLLVRRMEEEYRKAIKELEDTFARNVPAYKEPLNQLLDQHPDLFI